MPNETSLHSASPHSAYLRYFNEFLPGILGKLMMEDLKHLNCCVDIVVTDAEESPWCIEVIDGRLKYVGHAGPDAQCKFLLSVETLLAVVEAKVAPERAFFDARIDIKGDVAVGLQLSTVLEAFFSRFPFDAAT